jgi:hypothetical protein
MMIAIIVFYSAASFAELNKPKSPAREKLKKEQTIQYKFKHGLLTKTDKQQSTNKFDGNKNGNVIKEDENYFNDRVYIKFKSHNLQLNQVNPENKKLFTNSFSNSGMDALSSKYNVNKIEEAFKINSKKYEDYLKNNNLTNDPKRNLKNIFIIYFNSPVDYKKVISDFSKFDNVEYVERVPKNKYFATPNDSYYNDQFYFPIIKADSAWNIHKGQNGDSTIIVGICDSGVEWFHSDLRENLYQNLAEDADDDGHTIEFVDGQWVLDPDDLDGYDADGNGYVDDLIGYNFYTDDGSEYNDPIASGDNQHGTHVAGISAGRTNNSNGVASISWNVKFLPTKHGDNAGSPYIYNGYDGLIYLGEFGADIINCSWGGGGFAQSDQDVIDYVTGLGSIIIAAAGNDDMNYFHYPSSYHGVISVGSVASNDEKAYYSNYGTAVDISAHGGDTYIDGGILSTVPGGNYDYFQGTSMASPLVAGLTALIKSYKPKWSNSKIIESLLSNADNINDHIPDYINNMGYGRINAYKSLKDTNTTLSKLLKLAKMEEQFTPDKNVFSPGDIVEIDYRFSNFNPLKGTSNLSYALTALDTNLTIITGSGTATVNPDADFWVGTLKFKVNPNINTLKAIGQLKLKLSSDNGIQGDSIFYTDITILNLGQLPNAFAYVAYGQGYDPQGPVSFNTGDATNLNFLGEDTSPVYARAGTWYEGKWYCIENNYDFVTYDTTDGTRTYIGNPGVGINGLAYDPSSNVIWGVGGDDYASLYKINPEDGSAELMFEPGSGLILINLACNKWGDLYAIDINYDYMIYYDKWTGDIYYTAALGDDYIYAQDMEFDLNSGMMFAATYNYDGESSISFFDFNSNTMNKLSDIQNNDEITGLAFPNDYQPYNVDLVSPKFNEGVKYDVTFKWKKYSGASSYIVYISDTPYFDVYTTVETTDTTIVVAEGNLEIKKYYWFVEAVLNNGSELSGLWMFNHEDLYCMPVHQSCDEYIAKFELSNISNSSECGLYSGYSDYSEISGDVYQGVDYEVKVTNGHAYIDDYCGIWIDYNKDGTFDSNEFLELTSPDSGSHFFGTIHVPETAEISSVRLRCRIVYSTELDPCDLVNWGEAEDYTLNIKGHIAAKLIYPVDSSNVLSNTILVWENNYPVVKTDIQISTVSNFSTLTEEASKAEYYYFTANLSNNSLYYWRARTIFDVGTVRDTTAWSDYKVFTTNAAQTTPKIVKVKAILFGLWANDKHLPGQVAIELRTGSSLLNSTVSKRLSAVIDSLGTSVADFSELADGDYWLVVRATGYLPVAAPSKITISTSGVSYNFTTGSGQSVSGTNAMIQPGGTGPWMIRSGDFNNSRSVTATDMNSFFLPNNGKSVSSGIPAP